LKSLAENGDIEAQFDLSEAYENGDGVPSDSLKAYKWRLLAAENGHGKALLKLGRYSEKYLKIEEAEKWFRKAAELGDLEAKRRLEIIYVVGKKEVLWATYLNAEEGNATAQNVLGSYYEIGHGVPKNLSEAMKWRRISAEQGNPNAQYIVGTYYQKGMGGAKDLEEAVEWFRKAAEQGHSAAQLALGMAFALGDGVPRDVVEAYKWINLSATPAKSRDKEVQDILEKVMTPEQIAKKDNKASEYRKVLEEAMTPKQIAKAQKLSQEWLIQRAQQETAGERSQ